MKILTSLIVILTLSFFSTSVGYLMGYNQGWQLGYQVGQTDQLMKFAGKVFKHISERLKD